MYECSYNKYITANHAMHVALVNKKMALGDFIAFTKSLHEQSEVSKYFTISFDQKLPLNVLYLQPVHTAEQLDLMK